VAGPLVGLDDADLLLRDDARERAELGDERVERGVVERIELPPVRIVPAVSPSSVATVRAVSVWSPVTITTRSPAACSAAIA
jgi:hypothetical protein